MKRRLIIATRNAHKTQEIRAMLGAGWTVEDLTTRADLPEPAETGDSFAANSYIKAQAGSAASPGNWVLADDSGLEVDVLGGAPGVRSARYAAPEATDADNRRRLATELQRVVGDKWQSPQFDGAVEGCVVHPADGEGGFGYDPVFVPAGYAESFGMLPAEVKNALSHRARALRQVIAWLSEQPGKLARERVS